MTDQHPISVPQELLNQWCQWKPGQTPENFWRKIANNAAQWGADQELEACCEWLKSEGYSGTVIELRDRRRPKPPSLKEQALEQLGSIQTDLNKFGMGISTDTIRRALEALPSDH